MLNQMEAAMLKGRGYGEIAYRVINERSVAATATKDGHRAEALGVNSQDAERKLIALVTRP